MFIEAREILPVDDARFRHMFTMATAYGERRLGWKGSLGNFSVSGVRDLDKDNLLRRIFPRVCVIEDFTGGFLVNPMRVGLIAQKAELTQSDIKPQIVAISEQREIALANQTNLYLESCPAHGDSVYWQVGKNRTNVSFWANNYRQAVRETRIEWAQRTAKMYEGFEQPGVLTGKPGTRMVLASNFDSQNTYAVMELSPKGAKIVEWHLGNPEEEHLDFLVDLKGY